MKKFILTIVMLFGLSGCGQQANYLEAEPYLEYTYKKIDELNSDYIPTAKLYFEKVGIPNFGKTIDKYMGKVIEKELEGLSKVEASAVYKEYTKEIDKIMEEEYKSKIDFNLAQMKTILEDEKALEKRKDYFEELKKYYSENKEQVNDYLKRLFANYEEELDVE